MTDTLTPHHTDTTRMPIHEVVQYLLDRLGPTLVAYMADTRSRSMPPKWAKPPTEPGHAEPADAKVQRIKLAHTVFTAIADADDEYVARSWLISANPRFDGATPADLIRSNDAKSVYAAAGAFVNDDYYA
ncbi:antitoxin Xre/MbcA/ParS toxin-binding domain-containing protein [Tomitella cavernea]|uniref:Antitoxin Xre/MbcA/ParS-like toxin-binding domain-containing protein n=1 Tax=Tomitella cavernea TaxID=1387982 RepID=A0ABP9C2U9_9ACTN|nr:antitoxin Xre/MbcA/ParS toxin-binding domain-containing protein [Tomitella cavernea]